MNPPELKIDLENPEIALLVQRYELLTKRMLKYDVIDGVLYRMIWSEQAISERKKLQQTKYKQTYDSKKDVILEKAKLRYRESHPNARDYKKTEDEQLPYYLRMKLMKSPFKKGVPQINEPERGDGTPLHINDTTVIIQGDT